MTTYSVLRIEESDFDSFKKRLHFTRSLSIKHFAAYSAVRVFRGDRPYTLAVSFTQNSNGGSTPSTLTESQTCAVLEGLKQCDLSGITSRTVRVLSDNEGNILIANWADEYLSGSSVNTKNSLTELRTQLALPNDSDFSDIKDALAWLHSQGFASDGKSVHTIGSGDLSEPLTWSLAQMVSLLRSGSVSISSPDRQGIYAMILGFVEQQPDEETSSMIEVDESFITRFAILVGNDRVCTDSIRSLAMQFFNRIVVPNSRGEIFKFLRLVDPPLAQNLSKTPQAVDRLVSSLLACTLSDVDLVYLWDKLLVADPDVLIKVIAFCLVEVRELILSSTTEESLRDIVGTLGDLVQDFNSLLQLALENYSI